MHNHNHMNQIHRYMTIVTMYLILNFNKILLQKNSYREHKYHLSSVF